MSVLVTGAMGHVGYATVIACTSTGLDVVAHDQLNFDPKLAKAAGANVTWVRGDVTDWSGLLEIAREHNVDGVIHSAAFANDHVCRPIPLSAMQVNVLGTQNLLELARQLKWRRVVYVSTGAVYQASDPDGFIRETDHPFPKNVYATTKYMGELLVNMYIKTYGVSACVVRASWIWGPPLITRGFDGPRGPIPYFLIRALRGKTVHELSGGEFIANFTYVKDLANVLVNAYCKKSLPNDLYNVSNGEHYSTAQIVDAIKQVVPDADLSVGPGMQPWIDYTVLRGSFDIARIKSELGFKVLYPLEKGLADYAAWLKENLPS